MLDGRAESLAEDWGRQTVGGGEDAYKETNQYNLFR